MKTLKKLNKLRGILKRCTGAVVAFSGGVDSSLLLKVAQDILGDHVIAVTAVSSLYPRDEVITAKRIAKRIKCQHRIIRSNELHIATFIKNPKNRCYYCKIELFKKIKKIASYYGYSVIEASNKSDLRDFRPGLRAVRKLGVKSPLIEAGLRKDEIRALARKFGLPNWNKPSMACLASRIPYGTQIQSTILKRIASAERYVKKLRVTQVRVRDHYPIARIEILPRDMKKILGNHDKIVAYFKKLGYKFITLDIEGYQSGSLNR
ncbi:hypothetical protein AMJ52_03905 [candidate division TA06 bacterium DG_78]|uniref:Asparagine synthetase domain-containing protein n=1 Tax=candidate division TA06 bacterium DG_78 TaxID=1703772 RepID=A0A0S7YEX0_UNCT6|nr:MAG: hypothetical protein AMJ52_03905 [candidate division TA06 bacterium DG_78]